ncbi:hypothetical protein [Nonomuraea sp. GTA35]|uniref:hypothetical protein n=1 Tax=Nonomuraea sp. GTA35 TaxID=1676746 RepID=UPI0035C057ED
MAFLHRDEQVGRAQQQLHGMLRDLPAEGAFRADVVPDELAASCLHAVTAARELPSEDAAHRSVMVILDAVPHTAEG